jgi:hypothetical protein
MYRIICLRCFTLSSWCVFLGATAASGQTNTNQHRITPTAPATASFFYHCRSNKEMGGKFYFSQVTRGNAGVSLQELQNSFAAFLAARYGYPISSGVSCERNAEQAGEDSIRLATINNLRSQKFEAVEVEFTYSPVTNVPPPPAAPAPAPTPPPTPVAPPPTPARPATPTPRAVASPPPAVPPPAPPQTRYALCFAIMGPPARSVYFSDPFEVTAATSKVWSDAFRAVLQDKYQFVGTISCGVRGATLAEAESFAQERKNSSAPRKVVETGWKYQ